MASVVLPAEAIGSFAGNIPSIVQSSAYIYRGADQRMLWRHYNNMFTINWKQ